MKGVKHINAALHTLMHHILNKMMNVMEREERDVTFPWKRVRLVSTQFY
jgi:hypothetical protein